MRRINQIEMLEKRKKPIKDSNSKSPEEKTASKTTKKSIFTRIGQFIGLISKEEDQTKPLMHDYINNTE